MRVTVPHHKTCWMMPNNYPKWWNNLYGLFYLHSLPWTLPSELYYVERDLKVKQFVKLPTCKRSHQVEGPMSVSLKLPLVPYTVWVNSKGCGKTADAQAHKNFHCLYEPLHEKICFCHMWTTKAQNFKTIASLCSWAGRFESYLAATPENRFSHDMAHMNSFSHEPAHLSLNKLFKLW